MQVKKSILKTRLQHKLNEILKAKKACDATFPKYRKAYLKFLEDLKKQLLKATSYKEYEAMEILDRPDKPQLPYHWQDTTKRIQRNLALLDAVDGDVVEVEKLQTGRNYSLGVMLDDMFTD